MDTGTQELSPINMELIVEVASINTVSTSTDMELNLAEEPIKAISTVNLEIDRRGIAYETGCSDEIHGSGNDESDDDDDNIIITIDNKSRVEFAPEILKNIIDGTTKLLDELSKETDAKKCRELVGDKVQLHICTDTWIYIPMELKNEEFQAYATPYKSGGERISEEFLSKINKTLENHTNLQILDEHFLVMAHCQEERNSTKCKSSIAPIGVAVGLCTRTEINTIKVLEVANTQLAHGVIPLYGCFEQLINLTKKIIPKIPLYIYYPHNWNSIYKTPLYSFNASILKMTKNNLAENLKFVDEAWDRSNCVLASSMVHPRACSVCNLMKTIFNISEFSKKRAVETVQDEKFKTKPKTGKLCESSKHVFKIPFPSKPRINKLMINTKHRQTYRYSSQQRQTWNRLKREQISENFNCLVQKRRNAGIERKLITYQQVPRGRPQKIFNRRKFC